ncbi:MAG: serine esterase [Verrucomicrobia bacterium]|nr:serine esterase [Verrucomicrobiota bacterium]
MNRETRWNHVKLMLEQALIPAAAAASRRLMVVLHGLGDSMEGYHWLPDALALPAVSYLLVNAPDPYFDGYSWYDFSGDAGTGIERSRALLFELLDAQRAQGYPTEETVLFGFSQGSLMTVDVGLRYPHRFAGLVGISGYVHEPERLLAALSPRAFEQHLLLTHGTRDPLIPFAAVREQVNLLKAAGLHIQWHEFVKDHTIAGELELEVVRDFVRARC